MKKLHMSPPRTVVEALKRISKPNHPERAWTPVRFHSLKEAIIATQRR